MSRQTDVDKAIQDLQAERAPLLERANALTAAIEALEHFKVKRAAVKRISRPSMVKPQGPERAA